MLEKYNKWLETFKRDYKTIKPTLLDAFNGAYYMATKDCSEESHIKLTENEINEIIDEAKQHAQIEFIKTEIKDEIKRTRQLMETRAQCVDYAGALKREGEIEALMRAYSIICNSE